MAADRRLLAHGARIVTGVIAAAALVVVAGAALVVPLPSVTAVPTSFTVDPAPAEEVRACSGPLVRLSDDTGAGATTISSVGTADLVTAASDPAAPLDVSALLSPDDVIAVAATSPQRVALPAEAVSAGTLFAAAQSQQPATDELVGLAAAACGEASPDSWLVAGATTVGRTSFVVLSNPGDVNAVIDLSVYGESGLIDSPGSKNIDVPARSTRILSLAGFAPDVAAPVVHVVASVGAVSAALQQSVVRGLEPGGVELAGVSAAPAPTQTVTGVQVTGTSVIAGRLADADYSDLQSVLRLFVPGTEPTAVTIDVAQERAGGAATQYQVGLTPGVVTEFPLQDIPDGTYTVTATADQPIVMGARTAAVGSERIDFAWYQSVAPLDTSFFVATAPGPGPRLHVVNTTGADVQVTLTDTAGVETAVTIGPGARAVDLVSGSSYTVTSTSPVAAAVTYRGDGQVASYGVAAPSPAAAPITVYP